jgi:hypothetical protein
MERSERQLKNSSYVPKWGKRYRQNQWVWLQVNKKILPILKQELKDGKKITKEHIHTLQRKTYSALEKKHGLKYGLLR